jgi:hypothetical protein
MLRRRYQWAAPGHSDSKGEVVMGILSKVLVVSVILVTGCTGDRNATMNQFISRGTLAQQRTENGDEISYWDGARFRGKPAAKNSLPGSSHAILPQGPWRHWHARRLSGVKWLYSVARENGTSIFFRMLLSALRWRFVTHRRRITC